ncbi:zinc finger protein Pegasus-like [Amphiura filiformis]|uniref:zinc finger protein Pegasus-like n=1 Tax=Amphiura filiformis TaxID=82378 RepID=UPI003B228CAC
MVSPTGHNSTTDSVENDLVDFSSLTGEYKCNQCAFQTTEEQAFMNHLVTNHSSTAVVDPNGLNSSQGAQNSSKDIKHEEQNDNPFNDEDACYEQDLPTEKDISELQLGRTTKPSYSSPLSTSLSSPVQSDIASTDHQHLNLTPSPQASTSRQMNDNTSSTSKDSALTSSGSYQTKHTYRCRHCDIIFPDNILFAIHRGAHGFHQPFQCNLCGQDCGNKYNFASHLQGCAL